MISELRAFLLRGNVVDLAVAVAIGTAFTAIVTAIVEGILNPLIALLVGANSIDGATVVIRDTTFSYGRVIGATINFVLVGTVLFLVVKGANRLIEARRREETDEVTQDETPEEIVLLREIRDRLGVPPTAP